MLVASSGPQHVRSHQTIPQEEFSEILSKVAKESMEEEDEREVGDKDEFLEHLELQEKLKYIVLKGGDHPLDSQETPEQKWSGSL